jgi:hypothetical protein
MLNFIVASILPILNSTTDGSYDSDMPFIGASLPVILKWHNGITAVPYIIDLSRPFF